MGPGLLHGFRAHVVPAQCRFAYFDHDDQPAAGRNETGNSLRQNALDPGFHGVLTAPAHPSREVDGADGTGAAFRSRTTPNRGQAGDRDVVLVVLMGLGCVPCSRDAGRAIAQGALAGRPRGGNTSGDNLVVM